LISNQNYFEMKKQKIITIGVILLVFTTTVFSFRLPENYYVADSMLSIIPDTETDSLKIDLLLKYAEDFSDELPDSLLFILQEVESHTPADGFNINKVRVTMLKAKLFMDMEQYPESLKNLFEAKKIFESYDRLVTDTMATNYYLKLLSDIGVVYIYSKNYDQAQSYFLMGLDYLNHVNADPSIDLFRKQFLRFNMNLGAYYAEIQDYERADLYFTKTMQYLDNDKPQFTATLFSNLSVIAKKNGNMGRAFDLLHQAIKICITSDYKRGLARCYNNLASCYYKINDIENAEINYSKSLEISKENNFQYSGIIALEQLSRIYSKHHNYKKAYETYIQFKSWSDSLFTLEKQKAITQLELQNKYEQRMNQNRLLQEKKDAEQKRRELLYLLITVFATMGFIILILFYSLQRSKTRHHKLVAEKKRLENKNLEREKNKLEEELEFKNKELATNVMYMVRKNELISHISEKLIKSKDIFKTENRFIIEEIIKELQSTTDQNVWKEFEVRFLQVHNDFYELLNEKFPDLSANEKRLCAFLRLNMTTKEVAAITCQSANSISVARFRLRKKIGLNSDENLISFLENL